MYIIFDCPKETKSQGKLGRDIYMKCSNPTAGGVNMYNSTGSSMPANKEMCPI